MATSKAAEKFQDKKAMALVRVFHELLRGGELNVGTDNPVKMALWLGATELLKQYADEFLPAPPAAERPSHD